ncbi:MAG: hypothetical protein IJA78_05435 [Clostridia bacterium]|nr:hypothetical protein [Clostridia bacterium]
MKKSIVKDSAIARFFDLLTNYVYFALCGGLLGRIFSAYERSDAIFRTSHLGRFSRADLGGGRWHRAFRRNVALAMDRNPLLRGIRWLTHQLLTCSLRTVGLFLITTGAYSAIVYWLSEVIWRGDDIAWTYIAVSLVALLLGIILLFSDLSLGFALQNGLFFHGVLMPLLGISDDTLKNIDARGRQGYVVAIPLGMATGALGALTHPLWLLVAFFALLLVLVILAIPETGVMLLLVFLPFVGFLPNASAWAVIAVVLPLIGYIGKLLRGNRAFHLEVQDFAVLLMVVFFLLSGVSLSGDGAFARALCSAVLICSYFLAVNVIATPTWRKRCRIAMLVGASAASVVAIVQFILAVVNARGQGLAMADFGMAVRAGFADSTTFAYFLVLVFPFALAQLVKSRQQYRFVLGFCCVLIAGAAVLSWVQSVWMAMVLIVAVFFLIYERRSFPVLLLGTTLLSTAYLMLTRAARTRTIAALRATSDVTFAQRTGMGRTVREIFFGRGTGLYSLDTGISHFLFGLGNGGLETVCSLYTAVDPSLAARSCNFWTYHLLEQGVFGLIGPILFFFLLLQNCFSVLCSPIGARKSPMPIAGVCMTVGVLFVSLFRYAWYDPAALALFFVVAALVVADARAERRRGLCAMDAAENSETYVEFEYYVGGAAARKHTGT